MSQFLKNLREKISKATPGELAKIAIVFLFIIVVFLLFFFTTQFISKNINMVFSGEKTISVSALNAENYTRMAKKVGINLAAPKNNAEAPAPQEIDKGSVSIKILNGTKEKGLAGALSQKLNAVGFTKTITGNTKNPYTSTTVSATENQKELGEIILEEVKKTYPNATLEASEEGQDVAVLIIIGKK